METPDPRREPEAFLLALYEAAVARALPSRNMASYLPKPPSKGRTLVLGAGKAGGAMAEAVDRLWPRNAPLSGLVVTRYGHVPPGYRQQPGRIEVVEASHPVPDEAGRRAAERIIELTRGLTADDLVLCLVSGGGSALLSMPAEGVSFDQKRTINQALLDSGAAIDEINVVRKHLSAIKGGRLAALCAPAHVVTLLISDVPGDDPAVIASGPTLPDPTTCADALAVVARYGIELPGPVRRRLESGELETPKPGDSCFHGNEVHLIATPQQSLDAAAAVARSAGLDAHVLSDGIEGESHVVGRVHAALARAVALRGEPFKRPCVILSGGETTVTVRSKGGRGGRATEFLLGAAIGLQSQPTVWALAADTDGIDGIEDNAGALVTPQTLQLAAAQGMKAQAFLDRNDAYGFFQPLGALVSPGPTFTNVNDFRAMLVL
jgi:glycerate 2-kinase